MLRDALVPQKPAIVRSSGVEIGDLSTALAG